MYSDLTSNTIINIKDLIILIMLNDFMVFKYIVRFCFYAQTIIIEHRVRLQYT